VEDPRYPWEVVVVADSFDQEADVTRELNFTINKGASFSKSFRFRTRSTGAIIDLTGASAILQARASDEDGAAHVFTVASYSKPTGGPDPWYGAALTVVGDEGRITMALTTANTDELPPGDYPYNFQVTFAGGQVTRYLVGTITIPNPVIQGTID
jgi:hypothetical protein